MFRRSVARRFTGVTPKENAATSGSISAQGLTVVAMVAALAGGTVGMEAMNVIFKIKSPYLGRKAFN